jgi:HPt (histidine-containing phosphotransfer) domain-containing protein
VDEKPQTATTSNVLDRSQALAAVGGDSRFLSDLAGIFEAACPTLLKGIQRALAAGDFLAAARAAHLLRVVAQNVAAEGVAGAALALEALAQHNLPNGAQEFYLVLQEEIERLKPVLSDLQSEATPYEC